MKLIGISKTELKKIISGFSEATEKLRGSTFTDTSLRNLYLTNEVRFYTIGELKEMLGWSETTVQKLFNDPRFPSTDFGKNKVVESHALIDYFSVRHERDREVYWRG